MSVVDIMYQPYATNFPYPSRLADQPFGGVPKMHEPLDLGGYSAPLAAEGLAIKEEDVDKESQPKETHYLTANCVLLTYFSGDISSVVDEHFSRALSQPSSYMADGQENKTLICRDVSLMSQRNFPPSFWNSTYQTTASLGTNPHDLQFASNPYIATSIHGISGLHPQDPWHYNLASQAHPYSHRPVHYDPSYPAMATAGRLATNYGALIMQPPSGRSGPFAGPCDVGKPSDRRYGDPHRLGPDFTGLDSPMQEVGKDMCWF